MKRKANLILTALIVAALLMTASVLLGGDSTLLERIKSAGASTASSAQLYSDDCYISSIEKGSVVTGTEYWDTDVDGETSLSYTAGYDGNDTNDIVRSFDYITYNYIYTTSGSSNDATLLVELTLECSPAVARFYTEGMKWMDSSTTTYYFENGETSDSYDDINAVTKQVMTAEYSLGNLSGATTNNLEIIIFTTNAENGTEIAPTFDVSIKGNDTDKVKTIKPDPVTVSSVVGDYYIKFTQASSMNVIGTYDFSTNNYNTTYKNQTCTVAVTDQTPNYRYGKATGRMEGFGVTVIMENINTSKGIKGLYFPTTDIEFDITLSTSSTSGGSNDIGDDGDDYVPLLWDYYENTRYSWFGKWGRQFVRHNGYAYAAAPFNKLYCHTYSTIYDSCYDGGTWTITQTGTYTYHVVISDYAIDLENVIFPTADNTYFTRTTSGSTYKANQFCISAGSLQILLQYPSSYTADDRDGKTWYLGLVASNLTVEDVDSPTLTSKSYLYQSISLLTSLKISQSGCNFMDKDSTAHSNNGAGLMLGSSYNSKDAYAYLYKTIKIWQKVAVSYDDDVRTVIGFIKWDDRGLSVDTDYSCSVSTGVTCESYSTYFAGRKNGWNETTDEATDDIMNAAHLSNSTDEEYSIVFFESVEQLEAAGYKCVGVLFIAQYAAGAYNPDQTTSFPMFCCPLKTTSDTDLLNNVYDAMADSIVSTETLTDDVLLTAVTGTDGAYTFNKEYDTEVSGTRVFKHNNSYSRVVYNDGVISKGTTNFTGGHSVLLCGERSTLTLETVDASINANGDAVYNLDSGDRTVKLSVQPTVTDLEFTLKNLANSTYSSHTTNVYVKVTLPAGLSYTTASAVWGTTAISPESITTNKDGTSTIIFMLANVTTPGDLAAITFACDITSAENNEEFTVISEIYSTYDQRVRQESFGNYTSVTFFAVTTAIAQVIKSTDTTLIEKNGTLIWNLYYGNNSDIEMPNSRIVDVLPSNGDDLGSEFSGTLTVTEITLDYSDATDLYSEDNKGSVALYIATSSVADEDSYGESITASTDAPTGFEAVTGAVDEYNHTITYTIPEDTTVYAFYFALGTLKTGSDVTVTITATTDGNEAEDSYCNCFYQCYGDQAVLTSGTVTSYVANRSLSGLVWIDEDADGVRDDGEELVSGAKVYLYRAGDENDSADDADLVLNFDNSNSIYLYKAYTTAGDEITSTTTDENGAYSFETLKAGTYYVVTDSIGVYGVTEKNAGNSDTNDSDADGYCDPTRKNATTLDLAYIADVEILDVAELGTYNYINEFNDFGFVDVTGSLTISKIDSLGGGALQNVEFTLSGNDTEETKETNKSGEITFTGITATTADETAVEYTLAETQALTGYEDVSTTWTVTATKTVVDNNLTAIVSVASDDSSFAVVSSSTESTDGKTSVYNSSTAVLTVANTSNTTSYTAEIIWDDNDNQDGKRPESITVTLTATAGGTTVDALCQDKDVSLVSGTNSYSVDFGDLPLYYNGNKVTYTISTSYQEDEIYSYTLSSTTDATTGDTAYTFTYTHTPETVTVPVTIVWSDSDDAEGHRPDSVNVSLATNTTYEITADDEWTYTFVDLPVYAEGEEIEYSFSCDDVTYYLKTVAYNKTTGYTVTYTLLTTTITLGGTKTVTGNTSENVRFIFDLYEMAGSLTKIDYYTMKSTEAGAYEFSSITFNEAGTYKYAIYEEKVSTTGWTYDTTVYYITVVVTLDTNAGNLVATVTYSTESFTDENAQTVTATNGVYSFADFKNSKDTATTAEVTVTATKVITGAETINTPLAFTLYNTSNETETDVQSVTLNGANTAIKSGDQITFSALKFTESMVGNSYTYTIKETTTAPEGWTYGDAITFTIEVSFDEKNNAVVATINETNYAGSTYNAGTFTNTYDAGTVEVTLEATATYVDATGEATVPTFTYSVYESDKDSAITNTTAKTSAETSDTDITFSNLTFDTAGTYYYLICVEEQDDAAWTADITTYLVTIVVTDDGKGNLAATIGDVDYSDSTYNVGSFTNTYATTSVTATVVWDDDANKEGFRPEEVTITLTDGTNTVSTTTVNSDSDWSYTFENLDVYSNGDEIPYTVTATIDGYDVVIRGSSDDEFIIAATRETSYKKITVTVTWDDNSDQDGARPKNVNIDLYRNGDLLHTLQLTDTEENSAILFSTANVWSYTFTDMSVYAEGEELVYTITPADVDDYELTSCEEDEDGNFAVLYTHVPEEQTITVTNTWVDEDDADGLRGDLVLTLIASDGTEYTGTLAKTEGSYTFTVFTYGDGDVLNYELVVSSLDGYTITAEVSDDGFALTSTHTVVPTTEATTTEATTAEATTEATTAEATTTEATTAEGTTTEVTTATETTTEAVTGSTTDEETTAATTAEATTNDSTTESTEEATTATSAKTGDKAPLTIAFAMMVIGLAGAVVTGKKRGRK